MGRSHAPLATYGLDWTQEMSYVWSPEKKFSTWRRLWIALAKAEKELGACVCGCMRG